MTAETPGTPASPRSSYGSTRRRWSASALVIAAVLSACADSDPATTGAAPDPDRSDTPTIATEHVVTAEDASDTERGDIIVESRREIGPRVLDVGAAMMMVIDSVEVSGDDIFVGVRVVNGSDQFLNLESEDNRYGQFLEMRDDLGNTYPARAVEPAGVAGYSVGGMRFRLEGPFDSDAEEFTVEIATTRGPLATNAIPAPEGHVLRWWNESPAVAFSDLVGTDQDDRILQVDEVVDRGTHLDVSIRANDASTGFSIPGDINATLTLADGTELESLPLDLPTAERSNEFTGVLRFLGTLPSEPGALSLLMAGVVVEIPIDCADESCPTPALTSEIEPSFALVPRLPDLLHFDVKPASLPRTSITI